MKHRWKLDENGKPDEWAWESGFHNGVYCECCGKSPCIHCDPDWFEMDDCPGTPKRKSMTNADRIRSMTDEELEAFLIDVDLDKVGSPFITEWGKWLKQPAEE